MSGLRIRNRLVEVDALRGLAALAVVLFHHTTQFAEVFNPSTRTTFSFASGHLGVNLFFIISGFVIFMTLEKTSRPMDFVVSRFSRLFPAYWVAIVLTFCITHWLGLPGKLVDFPAAIANLTMIHSLFRVPHVDGVYWTLEVELLFYCGMFLLYHFRKLHLIHWVVLGLLGLRIAYYFLDRFFGIELPWTISRLLILKHLPWFALGISIYLMVSRNEANTWRQQIITAICAVISLLIVDSLLLATLAIALGAAVFFAAAGRVALLRHGFLVWLGAISYPLYLLHENIGWSLQLRLGALGFHADITALIAIAVSLVMATLMTRWVERPAMRWIRNTYRSKQELAR